MPAGNNATCRATFRCFIFFCFCSLAGHLSFAAGYKSFFAKDTSDPLIKEYKTDEMTFLKKYGRDDSSSALIYFYFAKRSKTKSMVLLALSTSAAVGLFSAVVLASYPNANNPDDFADAFAFLWLALSIYAVATFTIIGIVRLIKYSRKKLLHHLKNYFDGVPIPPNIARSRAFQKLVFLQHHLVPRRNVFPRD